MLLCNIFFGQNDKLKVLNLSERLNDSTFSRASSIMLVSYNLNFNETMQIDDVSDILIPDSIPYPNKKIDFSLILNTNNDAVLREMNQKKNLNLKQIIHLSDILFNTCARYKIKKLNELGCYFPRNAIIFFDENNRVIDYVEICFQCRKVNVSKSFLKTEQLCSYLYLELESFFNSLGLKTKYEE